MQIHACNLSQRLTSVPYCRGEGWRARWSWDNQLRFIIYTFRHLSVLSEFSARSEVWCFPRVNVMDAGHSEQRLLNWSWFSNSLWLCGPASWLLHWRLLTHSRELNKWMDTIQRGSSVQLRAQKWSGLLQRHHIAWNNNVPLLKIPMTISFCDK